VPQVYGDGWMIVGDSGGFVNAVHREGSNLAMTTGRLAAETVIAAKAAGQGFDERQDAGRPTRTRSTRAS
jgi:electron transfer flavoprotein-quinone oxidoreductase